MDSIEQLNKKFRKASEIEELKVFCEKQHKELMSLLDKNKTLEEENQHLKTLVASNESFVLKAPSIITNEELICLQQIEILKNTSQTQELTLEETKKLSEYVKILKVIHLKSDNESDFTKHFNTEDLMKAVESGK